MKPLIKRGDLVLRPNYKGDQVIFQVARVLRVDDNFWITVQNAPDQPIRWAELYLRKMYTEKILLDKNGFDYV